MDLKQCVQFGHETVCASRPKEPNMIKIVKPDKTVEAKMLLGAVVVIPPVVVISDHMPRKMSPLHVMYENMLANSSSPSSRSSSDSGSHSGHNLLFQPHHGHDKHHGIGDKASCENECKTSSASYQAVKPDYGCDRKHKFIPMEDNWDDKSGSMRMGKHQQLQPYKEDQRQDKMLTSKDDNVERQHYHGVQTLAGTVLEIYKCEAYV